jgi:hypothetical protein
MQTENANILKDENGKKHKFSFMLVKKQDKKKMSWLSRLNNFKKT